MTGTSVRRAAGSLWGVRGRRQRGGGSGRGGRRAPGSPCGARGRHVWRCHAAPRSPAGRGTGRAGVRGAVVAHVVVVSVVVVARPVVRHTRPTPRAAELSAGSVGNTRQPIICVCVFAMRRSSQAAKVAPLPSRASASWLARAAAAPWAAPPLPPGVPSQRQPPRQRVTNNCADGQIRRVRLRCECRRRRRFHRHAQLRRVPSLTSPPSLYRCRHV